MLLSVTGSPIHPPPPLGALTHPTPPLAMRPRAPGRVPRAASPGRAPRRLLGRAPAPSPAAPRAPSQPRAPASPAAPAAACPGGSRASAASRPARLRGSRAPGARSVFAHARMCRATFNFQFNPFFFILV
jgi:hypothetical protein